MRVGQKIRHREQKFERNTCVYIKALLIEDRHIWERYLRIRGYPMPAMRIVGS